MERHEVGRVPDNMPSTLGPRRWLCHRAHRGRAVRAAADLAACVRPADLAAERSSGAPHRLGSRRTVIACRSPQSQLLSLSLFSRADAACTRHARSRRRPSPRRVQRTQSIPWRERWCARFASVRAFDRRRQTLCDAISRHVRVCPSIKPRSRRIAGGSMHCACSARSRSSRSQLATKSSWRSTSKRRCGSCRSSRSR